MITIIPPLEFRATPWKNGKGQTIELAINDGGHVNDFEWRLSVATVAEDGLFSDFSDLWRNLVFIEGNGIDLRHSDGHLEQLRQHGQLAGFDGGNRTTGTLIDGPITNFNIMSNPKSFQAEVLTSLQSSCAATATGDLTFIYSHRGDSQITLNQQPHSLPQGHLLKVSEESTKPLLIKGSLWVAVNFTKVA